MTDTNEEEIVDMDELTEEELDENETTDVNDVPDPDNFDEPTVNNEKI